MAAFSPRALRGRESSAFLERHPKKPPFFFFGGGVDIDADADASFEGIVKMYESASRVESGVRLRLTMTIKTKMIVDGRYGGTVSSNVEENWKGNSGALQNNKHAKLGSNQALSWTSALHKVRLHLQCTVASLPVGGKLGEIRLRSVLQYSGGWVVSGRAMNSDGGVEQ